MTPEAYQVELQLAIASSEFREYLQFIPIRIKAQLQSF